MKITMEHGSGGRATGELINEIFAKEFDNEILAQMEDSAVIDGCSKIVMTTDSFVVDPLEFPGGDIGRLCICGTVNDLLMRGAVPKYITCGFILQEGADTEQIKRIVISMQNTAKEAGVIIVAGDTKVVEGNGGLFINTAGVGFLTGHTDISSKNCRPGDVVIVSGNMGDHHAAILSSRMEITNSIVSDNAPLNEIVHNLLSEGIEVHTLRDITRGGLATVMKELSDASACQIDLNEETIPVNLQVKDFCGLLGLDPLYMGNEGKLVAVVPNHQAMQARDIIRKSAYGQDADIIGHISELPGDAKGGKVILHTFIGGKRILDVLQGEGLPRIC